MAICLEGFQKAQPGERPDERLTVLVYQEQYFPILQLKFPNLNRLPIRLLHPRIHALLSMIITKRLQWMGSALTELHFSTISEYFLRSESK